MLSSAISLSYLLAIRKKSLWSKHLRIFKSNSIFLSLLSGKYLLLNLIVIVQTREAYTHLQVHMWSVKDTAYSRTTHYQHTLKIELAVIHKKVQLLAKQCTFFKRVMYKYYIYIQRIPYMCLYLHYCTCTVK